MNLEDYTLSFIDMHQNGMLSEEEVNEFIEEGLYDEEILESYILHLEEQEEIYQAYLNGEIDDSTISDLLENEYFTNDYADLLIEASLSDMVKSQIEKTKKSPIIGTMIRKNEAMKKRPGLYKGIVGNPAFKKSFTKKADEVAGAAAGGAAKAGGSILSKIGNSLTKTPKRKAWAGIVGAGLAAGAHFGTMYSGELDLRDYKAKAEKYNDLVKDKHESHWYNPASWGAPSQEKIDNAKKEMLKAKDKARGNWYYRMVKGNLTDHGDSYGSITDSLRKE